MQRERDNPKPQTLNLAPSRQVVGVAFQSLEGAENIGFIIPVPIIEHFLEDVRRNEGEKPFSPRPWSETQTLSPQPGTLSKIRASQRGHTLKPKP